MLSGHLTKCRIQTNKTSFTQLLQLILFLLKHFPEIITCNNHTCKENQIVKKLTLQVLINCCEHLVMYL